MPTPAILPRLGRRVLAEQLGAKQSAETHFLVHFVFTTLVWQIGQPQRTLRTAASLPDVSLGFRVPTLLQLSLGPQAIPYETRGLPQKTYPQATDASMPSCSSGPVGLRNAVNFDFKLFDCCTETAWLRTSWSKRRAYFSVGSITLDSLRN